MHSSTEYYVDYLDAKKGVDLVMSRRKIRVIDFIVYLSILIPALPFIGHAIMVHINQSDVVIKVKRMDRVRDANSSKYLIFTQNETFQNTDEFFLGKFNSSDIYGLLEEGKTYKARVVGVRIPFLSMYRNIIAVENVTDTLKNRHNSNQINTFDLSKYLENTTRPKTTQTVILGNLHL